MQGRTRTHLRSSSLQLRAAACACAVLGMAAPLLAAMPVALALALLGALNMASACSQKRSTSASGSCAASITSTNWPALHVACVDDDDEELHDSSTPASRATSCGQEGKKESMCDDGHGHVLT